MKFARLLRVLKAYPLVGKVVLALLKVFLQATGAGVEHRALTEPKTERRIDTETDRKDFMR